MEPSKEAIAVRVARLNRQIVGKGNGGNKVMTKAIDREALLDAITVLYDECNDDPVKKCDELVRAFVDKYRSILAELRRTRVCISDFDILQTIGRGYFGDVHMVREKHTSDVYALKIVKKERARKKAAGASEDERDVLATANTPWLPRLQYAFQDNNNLYLVMELCNGGDLAGFLARRNHPLSEKDAAFYVAETAHALKALHGMGFVHRDVKPANIFLDRCGHVKLGDVGSSCRLSDEWGGWFGGTAQYLAPELLAAAACAARHQGCAASCQGRAPTAISACDYWSLGVVAFELVTQRRPFSDGNEDSIPHILANIQKYEANPTTPFLEGEASPHWESLVSGLLRVSPAARFNYLLTLQHPALASLASPTIRDQAPPWVPCVRGPEDGSYFSPEPRDTPPASAAQFRSRPPFAGQLPFIGFSYVAPEENEDHSGGFNASHDCTAINLATFKSAEKLAALRGREVSSLQARLAAAEAAEAMGAGLAARARRDAALDAERLRARLQADITALSVQNKRLERQIEVEKEERMALERTNQQLNSNISDRNSAELRLAQAQAAELASERDSLKEEIKRLESKVAEIQADCARAAVVADTAKAQQRHYKDIIEHVKDLKHRRLTEINVRPIDTIAKERALRRQTLSGGENDSKENGARIAAAEALVAKESRAREQVQRRMEAVHEENTCLRAELADARNELATLQEKLGEKKRVADSSSETAKELQVQLAQERMRVTSLLVQVQELERGIQDAGRREAALEEQCSRTEARLNERLEAAEARAAAALQEDARRREKVNTLEQLVRQLEREVSALESRSCALCEERERDAGGERDRDAHSDTESVDGHAAQAQVSLLKEQLDKAEVQLQARTEEIAALRQETRTANLERWRKERELNDLQVEHKSKERDLKRLEDRLTHAVEARRTAEQKASALQSEITMLKPQHERASKELARVKEQLEKLQKAHETAQAEVDRSRNDIRKLKSELQYSERRRMHAEEQEELSSRERAQLRDELTELRGTCNELTQNNKALQEACTVLEEQLTDLEKLADIHEIKNKDLEAECHRIRSELDACHSKLVAAERQAAEKGAAANSAAQMHEEARDQAKHYHCQVQLFKERLENREVRVSELEGRVAELEAEVSGGSAALGSAARRVRDLQEECAALRTRIGLHHAGALQLQAALQDTQEELAAVREASEAATAWWRTRETKADATLRQQAKLIDFLQVKVEEANRKKCSLSHKLFGRSGRRSSPPLRRTNRELRDEVERLRARLATSSLNGDSCPPTPKLKSKPVVNGKRSIDVPDSGDDKLLIVWADGTRERMHARCSDGMLILSKGDKEYTAQLLSTDASNLPQNEANRAFTVHVEGSPSPASIVCRDSCVARGWSSRLVPAPLYRAAPMAHTDRAPLSALYVASTALAIGCTDGLYSLRGPINLELDSDVSPPRQSTNYSIECICMVNGQTLIISGGLVLQAGAMSVTSALRRAANLKPTISVTKIRLPDHTKPHCITVMSDSSAEENGPCAAIACGRRVFLLRYEAASIEFRIMRSLTIDRLPTSLLLTAKTLYIGGEKPLKINLPSGALEQFAMDEITVLAAAKKHTPPQAILLINENPTEILICYSECGIFVDESGKRTRNEEPKWSSAVQAWEFVNPFLYLIGEDRITILYINEDAYKAPPCTCDTTSLASTASECYMPDIYNYKIKEPLLLGTAPNGIIVRTKVDNGFDIVLIDGMAAFKSIGASVESLETISDNKGSCSDIAQSVNDLNQNMADLPHDESQESMEATTGFLADIRKRARQLRKKTKKEQHQTQEDVIKEILTTEVGLKRTTTGRKSPALISEFDSESESETDEYGTESTKETADLCAEMFTRQVRFQ